MTIQERITAADTPEKVRGLLTEILGEHQHRLDELKAENATLATRTATAEAMATEFRQAVAALKEAQTAAAFAQVEQTSDEANLRMFIREDGGVQMRGGKPSVDEPWAPGLLDTRENLGPWHRELRRLWTMRSIVRTRSHDGKSPMVDKMLSRHIKKAPPVIRRSLDIPDVHSRIFGTTSAGAEWIPTENLVPDIDMAVGLMVEGRIAALFPSMQMSTEVLTIPFATTGGTPYLQGEPVSDPAMFTASIPTTAQRTHTAKTFALRYEIDNNSAEDAIVDAYGILSQMIAGDLVDGEEDAIINGDTAATHQDTGIATWNPNGRWSASSFGSSADHRKAWIGLRARAFDVSNTIDHSASQTYDGALVLRSMLQARSNGAAFIANEKYLYQKMMAFNELQLTTSAVGQVSRDGRITEIAGIPVYMSYFMTADQAATGLYTGSGTYASLLCADLSRFTRFIRRGAAVELQRDASRGVTQMVATWRGTFKTNDSSTAKNVALAFKLLS